MNNQFDTNFRYKKIVVYDGTFSFFTDMNVFISICMSSFRYLK